MIKFRLGCKVRDMVSGLEGILVTRCDYLNGCVRCGIQPPMSKDGKVPDCEYVDEQQLSYVGPGILDKAYQGPPEENGGPSSYDPK